MTKLIIQIPCLNEADHLPETIAALPRRIEGVDVIEYLVIDDGSSDGTAEIARQHGVHHIVRHRRNRGLAAAFQTGLDCALREGADIIVNSDADGQHAGSDIPRLVAPIVSFEADVVIGDRGVGDHYEFSWLKRRLQRLGTFVVRSLSRTEIHDAVSGFRAMSREAAQRIFITTDFSYTTDMLIQAGRKRMRIVSIPIETNPASRPSRLMKSIPHFISQTGVTIIRAYATHNALRVFGFIGLIFFIIGLLPMIRLVWFAIIGESGHLQSLIAGGASMLLGGLIMLLGLLADLISSNRRISEKTLEKLRTLEQDIKNLSCESD